MASVNAVQYSVLDLADGVEVDAVADLTGSSVEDLEDDEINVSWLQVESALLRLYIDGSPTGSPDVEVFLEAEYERPGGETYWKEVAGTRLLIQSPSDTDAFHAELGKIGGPVQGFRLNGEAATLNASNKFTLDARIDLARRFF